jgi:threonine dehydrogenase-like Zn-dependent dehydrogenase
MSGLFGYSHLTGGYPGGQARICARAVFRRRADRHSRRLDDEQVLFLSDILPTGWMAAENAEIEPGDTVAVWGCGPVGLFAMQSALLMGAADVIAIDHTRTGWNWRGNWGRKVIDFRADPRA